MLRFAILAFLLFSATRSSAHVTAFYKGMYCLNGTVRGLDDQDNNAPVNPLFNLPKSQWWWHSVNHCDLFPPTPGDFLELPAGGNFTVELATNRASTTLSYGGKYTSDWLDGKTYPDNYSCQNPGGNIFPPSCCITTPNIHTQNESMAAGTAFAISYQSDLSQVTAENLVVFSVHYHSPWKRLTTYQVPAAMPPCPPGGCHCAWGWIPNGCGEPNIYMMGGKCNVTGATSTKPVGPGKPPVWCEGNSSACVSGPKQMLYWNQQDGNNIAVSGYDMSGSPKSPAYNMNTGFADGAQNDIFTP